jgi:hypothetical protein
MQINPAFRNLFKSVFLIGIALLLVSCASKPTIETDYDHSVDFSKYKTYGFFNPMGIENPNYSSVLGAVFRDAISKEMESRGYVKSDTPDLMVNVSGRMKDKTKVTTSPSMHGGYYGYRGGRYGAWGGYGYGSTTHVSNYTEGTVNVDLVDVGLKRMVWEGVAVGRVNESKTNEETRAAINSGIQEMFAGYPFRAGQ